MPAKVINLLGGPSTGKTCTALGLTYFMKRAGIKVKYVQEYAEDMVYENRSNILCDQLYLLAKQNRRLLTKIASNEYVITDSPLMLGMVYAKDGGTPEFRSTVWEHWNQYDNIMFYHPRDLGFDYQKQGRVQGSHEECIEIDERIQLFMPQSTVRLELGKDYIKQIVNQLGLTIDLFGPHRNYYFMGVDVATKPDTLAIHPPESEPGC